MSFLRPCAGCERHIFNDEPACPFCGAAQAAIAAPASPAEHRRGLSRTQRYALAVAAAGQLLVGCDEAVGVAIYSAPIPPYDAAVPDSSVGEDSSLPDDGATTDDDASTE